MLLSFIGRSFLRCRRKIISSSLYNAHHGNYNMKYLSLRPLSSGQFLQSCRLLSTSNNNFLDRRAVNNNIFLDKPEGKLEQADGKENIEKNLCGQIGVIGCGKMAEAILEGITKNQIQDPKSILVTDIHHSRLDYFHERFGVTPKANTRDVINSSDLVLCCVKPQNLTHELFDSCTFNEDCIFVSIIAGVPLEEFQELTGLSKIVRSMPNVSISLIIWIHLEIFTLDNTHISKILIILLLMHTDNIRHSFLIIVRSVSIILIFRLMLFFSALKSILSK